VRETQQALFVDEGRVADLFGPGRHKLSTGNLPILTNLRHWTKQLESPFKSEVYFFSTRLRLDRTWGTPAPITVRDTEFGVVRLGAFGIFSYRIASPQTFFTRVSATRETYLATELEGQLRATLVTMLGDHFAESRVPFLDMAANQVELASAVADRSRPAFEALGVALDTFHIQSIALPEELQVRLDERIGMGIVGGDLARYQRFQVAQAIPTAAAQEGGGAGAGVGLGAGIAMGQTMAQAFTTANATSGTGSASKGPEGNPASVGVLCGRCQARLERVTRFCPECGAGLA
jgi:membrane protease subunit (stomatin/prohibitin family)